jgi:hypothetical protein
MGADQSKGGVNSEIPYLRIRTETWVKESHGLYDYEGTELEVQNFTTSGNQRFKRLETKI